MIKEKDLTRTKFFTMNGTDIWKITHVKTVTVVDLVNCETGKTGTIRLGEQSSIGFVPVVMPKVKNEGRGTRGEGRGTKKKDGRKKPGKKKLVPAQRAGAQRIVKTKSPSFGKTGSGVRAGKKASSQYLGVTVKKTKAGKKKYYAQISRGGEWKNLGSHNIEEDAAAAVQEHLGNKVEAARLRMLAKKKTGTGQTKNPATKGSDNVEHRKMFAQESPDE